MRLNIGLVVSRHNDRERVGPANGPENRPKNGEVGGRVGRAWRANSSSRDSSSLKMYICQLLRTKGIYGHLSHWLIVLRTNLTNLPYFWIDIFERKSWSQVASPEHWALAIKCTREGWISSCNALQCRHVNRGLSTSHHSLSLPTKCAPLGSEMKDHAFG